MNNRRRKTSLTIFTSHFIARVRKGCVGFYCERELEIEQKLQYFDPHCYDRQLCVFLVLLMLNRWVLAFFTASYQQLLWSPNSIGGPEGPLGRVWLSLPHLVYNSVWSLWNSNSTELYNSSTSTRSPTRSLKSHVWSSSSGNNCHAVHRSLSSGASVYECTIGIFFSSSHFISQFPPTRFPLITAIGMCHLLPVHHLEWHFGPGRRSKYNTPADCFNSNLFPTKI